MSEETRTSENVDAAAACDRTAAAVRRLLGTGEVAVLLPGIAEEPALRPLLERVAKAGAPVADGAFAGVPLPGIDGAAIGAAAQPSRPLEDGDVAILEELAAALARELTLRESLSAHEGAERELELERHLIATLLEHSPDQLYFKDRESRYVRASRAVADRFRLDDPSELVGKSDLDFFGTDHARAALAAEQRLLESGVPIVGVEERETWPDGRDTWVSSTKVPVRDADGAIVGLFGVSRDVSARKRSEEALREGERQLRVLLEQLPAIVWTTDCDLRVISAAGAGLARLGLTPASAGTHDLLSLLEPAEGELTAAEAHRRALAGAPSGYRAGAGASAFECHTEPLRSPDGAIAGVVGVAVDISERRRTDEALRASEARKSAILESALDWVVTVDEGRRIVEVNPAAEEALEYARGTLAGRTLGEVLPDVAVAGAELPIGRRFETRARRSDGSMLPVEVAVTRVDLPGHDLFTVVVRDIADRKRAEEEVRAADAKYRTLVEELPLVTYITVLGDQLDALYVSPQIEYLTGYTPEEWLAEPGFAAAAVHPDDLERVIQEVARVESSTERMRTEYRLRHRDGRTIWVLDETVVVRDSFGAPLFRQGILVDVTERKHLEEQLTQSQRLEAVGKLAGGIAHDFNNLLTAITGYSDLLLLSLPSGDPLRLDADQIKKAADRAAGLTRQLLAFSRRQVLQPQVIDVNEVIRGVEDMLRRLIGEHIEPIIVLSPDIGTAKADPGQLEQVLVNLAVNARDAMPDGGKLVIESRNVQLDEAYAAEHVEVVPGRYVLLAVTDTGVGMDAPTRARVFEPFFTTKEPGKGTGLGLATVYGIVKQSGGHVSVYSELGHGSTFKVYLPRIDDEVARDGAGDDDGLGREGSETILLVEDESVVRQLVSKVLARSGYRVLEACQGNEALDICRSFSGPIDLMLTDVVMPGMSGSELAERISELRPDVKVIHMSGYTDEAIRHHGVLGRGKAFLPKPFTMETLARTVRDVLDG